MTKNFDKIKDDAFEIYNTFLSKLTSKEINSIVRCISSSLYSIEKDYQLTDPLELFCMFRISHPEWYGDIKKLIRQYSDIIKTETVNYATVTRLLELERYEKPEEVSIVSIISYQPNCIPHGKIHYTKEKGLFVCMIPNNTIILSTFVAAHEIAHLVINKVGIEDLEGDKISKAIAIEMLADYFAVFAYCFLTNVSGKKQKENLSKMLRVIATDDDLYNSDEIQIRELHMKQLLEKF